VTSLPRLVDMGVPRFLVAFTCNMIIAQRLVRKVCKDCTQSYVLAKPQLKELGELYDLPKVLENLAKQGLLPKGTTEDKLTFYRGAGCKQCGDEGYKGRMGIYEILEITKNIQDLINKNATGHEIKAGAEAEGMVSIVEDGFAKALQGLTSLEEIMRVTKE
jgi:type II secretory ATPase GspE/PulE/Tfp pilus assembly ATPase PilB-like protein